MPRHRMEDNPANTDCETCIFFLYIFAGETNGFCPTNIEEEEEKTIVTLYNLECRFLFLLLFLIFRKLFKHICP